MIELGTIRVVDRQKHINVYKDKQCIGEIIIKITDQHTEDKIFNLLRILSDNNKDCDLLK